MRSLSLIFINRFKHVALFFLLRSPASILNVFSDHLLILRSTLALCIYLFHHSTFIYPFRLTNTLSLFLSVRSLSTRIQSFLFLTELQALSMLRKFTNQHIGQAPSTRCHFYHPPCYNQSGATSQPEKKMSIVNFIIIVNPLIVSVLSLNDRTIRVRAG